MDRDYRNSYANSRMETERLNPMSQGAFILGVLSVISSLMIPVYLPCIFGGIAIVLASLSRGDGRMAFRARVGLAASIVSICINLMLLALGIYLILTVPGLREQLMSMMESMGAYTY